ncbi:MAG: hypothetical protein ACOYJC_07535 [Christensenellales bacterium]|jgi:hypothetical protein
MMFKRFWGKSVRFIRRALSHTFSAKRQAVDEQIDNYFKSKIQHKNKKPTLPCERQSVKKGRYDAIFFDSLKPASLDAGKQQTLIELGHATRFTGGMTAIHRGRMGDTGAAMVYP